MRGYWLVSYLVLWALVVALGLVVLALLRQIGVLHLRLSPTGALDTGEGPELGEPVPALAAIAGREAVVLFGSETCGICADLLPAAGALARAEPGLSVAVVSSSPRFTAAVPAPAVGLADAATMASWRVRSTPFAVHVDAGGVARAKGIVNTLEHLESLLEQGRGQGGASGGGAAPTAPRRDELTASAVGEAAGPLTQ